MACTSFYRKQKRCSTEVLEENVKIAQRSKKTLPPESQTEETPNKKRKFERENSPAKPASPVKLSRDEATLNETVTETKQKRSKTTKKRTKEKTDKLKLKTLKRVNHTEGQEREEHVLKALKNGIYGTRDELEEDLAAYVKQPYVKRRELAGVRRWRKAGGLSQVVFVVVVIVVVVYKRSTIFSLELSFLVWSLFSLRFRWQSLLASLCYLHILFQNFSAASFLFPVKGSARHIW